MKCNKAPASRKEHQNSSKMRIQHPLSTYLYGTQLKAGRITGSSLTIAPHSCVCYSCVWMVLCPALIAGNKHLSGKHGTLRWSILVGKQKHNVQSPTGILILLTSGIWNPRSSPSKESKSGIQAPLIDKKFEIQYREIGIHSLKSRIQGSL